MDSLSSLIDKGEYELVLTLSELSSAPEDLLFRLVALLHLNRSEEAMELLDKNRHELFRYKPVLTMKYDFELRFARNEFDEAYEDLNEFEQEDYISQEVEEALREARKLIRRKERGAKKKELSPEEIHARLIGEDAYLTLEALNALKPLDITPYMGDVEHLLLNNPSKEVCSYALILLVAKGFDRPVKAKTIFGKELEVTPTELTPPLTGEKFDSFRREILATGKDPSLARNAATLLEQISVLVFPQDIFRLYQHDALKLGLFLLAAKYLQTTVDGLTEIDPAMAREAGRIKGEIETILTENKPIL